MRSWRQKLKISHKQKKRVKVLKIFGIWPTELHFRWLKVYHYRDGDKSSNSHFDSVILPSKMKLVRATVRSADRPWPYDFRWPRSGWAWSCNDFYLDWSLLCSRYHLVFKRSSTASYTTKEGYFLIFLRNLNFEKFPEFLWWPRFDQSDLWWPRYHDTFELMAWYYSSSKEQ